MFRVSVSTSFNATHAVTIQGVEEIPHNHEWGVVVVLEGESLDDDGLLIDFIEIEQLLEHTIEPFRDSNLNTTTTLGGDNPSAERVALYIGNSMLEQIKEPIRIQSVTVTEAPNCQATYVL